MTKEYFCEVINRVKLIHDYHNELFSLNQKYNNRYRLFNIGDVDSYPTLEDDVIGLLEDKYNTNAIAYFIYDLNFGKEWKPGSFIDNGEDINLSSIENLYNYIKKAEE